MAFGGASMGVPTGAWTTSLCGCHEDYSGLCCSLFCPCIIVGRNTNLVTDGFTESTTASCIFGVLQAVSLGSLGFLYTCGYRQRLREKYFLPEEPCNDCCTHWLCLPCALAQENRELKNRGWDPKLGFASNVRAFQARGMPPPPQRMGK